MIFFSVIKKYFRVKRIILSFLFVFCLQSCKKDYDLTITDVEFFPSELYNPRSVENRFLTYELTFVSDFTVDPPYVTRPGGVGDINYVNTILEDEFFISSDQDFYIGNDTIKKNNNLFRFFEYQYEKELFFLSYSFRSNQDFLNDDGYYKFYFRAILSDNVELFDSCIVKIQF